MGFEEVKELKQEEKIKVLIADDDAPTRILLRAAVSQWGYDVVEAADGEDAWNILQQPNMPQLLIVDWLMPKLDGIDLCRRVKNEIKYFPYIILLTQLSGTTNIVKGLEAGADEFLSKPFNMAELQSRLSVGARIIRYKNKLSRKNKQLKLYFVQASELAKIVKGLMATQDPQQSEKINELHADFNRIMTAIDELKLESDQEGDES